MLFRSMGIFEPGSEQLDWMANYLEDRRFFDSGDSIGVPGHFPTEESEADWFGRAGFPRAQPYYGGYPEVCVARDDVKAFVRTSLNAIAAMCNLEDGSVYENPWASVWNKSADTGSFLQVTRYFFVVERDKDLWLAPFLSSQWLREGQQVSVKRMPTFYGEVSYTISSHTDEGYIEAEITPPTREKPEALVVRLRHPDDKPIASVTVEGKPWHDFDAATGTVRLKEWAGPITIIARF